MTIRRRFPFSFPEQKSKLKRFFSALIHIDCILTTEREIITSFVEIQFYAFVLCACIFWLLKNGSLF